LVAGHVTASLPPSRIQRLTVVCAHPTEDLPDRLFEQGLGTHVGFSISVSGTVIGLSATDASLHHPAIAHHCGREGYRPRKENRWEPAQGGTGGWRNEAMHLAISYHSLAPVNANPRPVSA
jgi:hypothetical protein